MKKLLLLVAISLFVLATGETQAQGLLKRLSNKAKQTIEKKMEEKAEEKVEEEVGKKVDETLESLEKEEEEQKKEEQKEQTSQEKRSMGALKGMLGKMGMDTSPVEIEDSYTFTSNVKMYIESYKSNGNLESKGFFNSFFNQKNNSFAYEMISEEKGNEGKAFMIYDQKNKASIILSDKDGEKTGIVTGINFGLTEQDMSDMNEINEIDDHDLTALNNNIRKTGKTKTILGYKCSEYKFKDEDVESTVWMTKEKVWQVNNMLSAIYKSSSYSSGFPAGFMMEMESNNLHSQEKSIMKVTEVNDNINKKISLPDYEVMNMGSFNVEGME